MPRVPQSRTFTVETFESEKRTVRFTLSKVSTVKVRLWGTRGMSVSRDFTLPRGKHAFAWRPPGRGRYQLRIEARGPSGPAGVEQRVFKVTTPKKPKAKKKEKKKEAAPRSRRKGISQVRGAAGAASRRQP